MTPTEQAIGSHSEFSDSAARVVGHYTMFLAQAKIVFVPQRGVCST